MPEVPGFLPSTRGFSFSNSWPSQPDKVIPTPFGDIAIGDASNGLCGGMGFTVRDYFEAGLVAPSGRQPSFGQPLYDFIVDRLFASFDMPNGPTKYYDWMTTSDHDTWFKSGVARRTIVDEWPAIKNDLDSGMLSCLALVTVFSLNPGDMGHNHQVLAYGYDLVGDDLTVRIYDPNSPLDDNIGLSLNLGNPAHTTPISHNVNIGFPIRGFFRIPYVFTSPPQIDDAEIDTFFAPQAMPAGAAAQVTLQVRNTGTTTWTSGGANPYRLRLAAPAGQHHVGVQRVDVPRTVGPKEQVDFPFVVTAPATGGQLPMGWRMVHEFVEWFGELEDRSVSIIAPVAPTSPCDQLRGEIEATEDEIANLQADLHDVVGTGKAFLAAQIRKRRGTSSSCARRRQLLQLLQL